MTVKDTISDMGTFFTIQIIADLRSSSSMEIRILKEKRKRSFILSVFDAI